jgi:hypothetical protein
MKTIAIATKAAIPFSAPGIGLRRRRLGFGGGLDAGGGGGFEDAGAGLADRGVSPGWCLGIGAAFSF